MLEHWIWLSLLPKLSPEEKLALLARCRDPEAIYEYPQAAVRELEIDPQLLQDRDLTRARQIVAQCAEMRIGVVAYTDSAYPKRLKNVEQPPLVLYYRGQLPDWDAAPVIGVVGTRKASPYGQQMAKSLGSSLRRSGCILVSGGASGIDRYALEGALDAGDGAVAVLGCGADMIYPKSNEALFLQLYERGCVITEYPPKTPAYSWNFPQRNRIISGLSNGVLVVEAPEKSGALITARYAWDQGRDVFVVPGNINVASCSGSNQLLRDKALPVFDSWDIVREYTALYPGKLRRVQQEVNPPQTLPPTPVSSEQNTLPPKKDKKPVDKREKSNYSGMVKDTGSLTPLQQQILSKLTSTPQSVDELIVQLELPAAQVLSQLTKLALQGWIVQYPGKRVARK